MEPWLLGPTRQDDATVVTLSHLSQGMSKLRLYELQPAPTSPIELRQGFVSDGSEDGYTLIELLVVLMLLGMIGVLTIGNINFGDRAWKMVADSNARVSGTMVALTRIRSTVASAKPAARYESDSRGNVAGSARQLSFTGPAAGGLADYQLVISDAGTSSSGIAMSLGSHASGDAITSHIDIAALSFSFRADEMKPGYWLNEWQPAWPLPDLVRLRLGEGLPDLVIRIVTTHRSPCSISPPLPGCPQLALEEQ